MSLLKVLRAMLLYVTVITTLCASSAFADIEAVAEGNSTVMNTTRYLEEAATDFRIAMLNAVNKERTARGLSKFCMNRKLQDAAQIHSADMAKRNFLSHTGSDGSTMSSRVRAAGYRWATVAENVAAGQATVSSVLASWMNSNAHRANILSNKHKMFGCGYVATSNSKYKHYWTQNFALDSSMSLQDLASVNSQRAQQTAINAFNRFITSAGVSTDYIGASLLGDASEAVFVKLMDRFGAHLAFVEGRGGKPLARTRW
ncbi:hypothetical protein F443_14368 [Phytophthora nicotianae P1569]|uniref:SCP domain-containing protein n=1 Tax=Phytophthora nicotianae P1569 TaxID=1317065 RepID=V9ENT4_PHYNI|nr:hypothetical protein F443_14368 [Phytophthora nicotianae P1569]